MTIDWASLGLVAVTTVVAAIAIVGIFALGIAALTVGGRADGTVPPGRAGAARVAGFGCLAVAGASRSTAST